MNAIKKIFLIVSFLSFELFTAPKIHLFKLDNGLQILVMPNKKEQKVAVRLIYNVGSNLEETGQAGYAHWLEHMLFKGTSINGEINLSESDIFEITNRLAAYANAQTSHHDTTYFLNVPDDSLQAAFYILADCMQNATIAQDHLNSEVKTVIQELKERKDNFNSSLLEKMISTIFADHPYHRPIIGYKHDLFAMNRESLLAFYKKHYIPNNAVLVVVGNVDPQEIYQEAQKQFGQIKPDPNYTHPQFNFTYNISSHTITQFSPVQTTKLAMAFVVPGFNHRMHHISDLLHRVLTGGKTSLLYKDLVDDSQIAYSVSSFSLYYDEYDLFFITCSPKDESQIPVIIEKVNKHLATLAQEEVEKKRIHQGCKQLKNEFYDRLQDNQEQAAFIGRTHRSLNDPEYIFRNLWDDEELCCEQMKDFIQLYLRPSVMHKGIILPLPREERPFYQHIQKKSDLVDKEILSSKQRTTDVEEPNYAKKIAIPEYKPMHFAKPETFQLSNGLNVFYYHNPEIPKVEVLIQLKADGDYDSVEKPGLYKTTCMLLAEGGTKKYTALEFAQELERNVIGLAVDPGIIQMSMLTEDIKTGFDLCAELLTHPLFDESELEKVRSMAIYDYQLSRDNQKLITTDLINNHLYKDHPMGKNLMGNIDSLNAISREDILAFFQSYFSPSDANLFIVGDLSNCDLKSILEESLGRWQHRQVGPIHYPQLTTPAATVIDHLIERDQTVLAFAGPSINRSHPDFYRLAILNHILPIRLFRLRERTGIFYHINASTLINAGKQPGIWRVQTKVSNDRLKEAEVMILQVIRSASETITQEEVDIAKRNILADIPQLFSTNLGMINAFSFLRFHDLPWTYFEEQYDRLKDISADDVKNAAKNLLNPDSMLTVRVGRV